jgi:hypothetical protein
MAYREVSMIEITEVLRQWLAGARRKQIARRLGLDPKTVRRVANPGERLTSSITQVVLGYGFTPALGVQVNLPIISRTFRRLEDGRLRRGDETGIGNLALLGQWTVFRLATEESVLRLSLLGGLEFPTRDTDRLAEELAPRHVHTAAARGQRAGSAGVVNLGTGPSPIAGSGTIAQSFPDALYAGTLHVNVHSTTFPDGEIRGQIDRFLP